MLTTIKSHVIKFYKNSLNKMPNLKLKRMCLLYFLNTPFLMLTILSLEICLFIVECVYKNIYNFVWIPSQKLVFLRSKVRQIKQNTCQKCNYDLETWRFTSHFMFNIRYGCYTLNRFIFWLFESLSFYIWHLLATSNSCFLSHLGFQIWFRKCCIWTKILLITQIWFIV